MLQTLTVNGNPVTTVVLPVKPGLRSVEFTMMDAVATVTSVFTGQVQAQAWPGADMLSGTMTLPALTQADADVWIAFLAECRGMLNGFLLGDPARSSPKGTGRGAPVVDGSNAANNQAGATTLYTAGWLPNGIGELLPGDYLQLGYRLHRVLERVNADANGKAPIAVWPSLREVPANGQQVILKNPVGIFRLAQNQRVWSADYTRLTHLSFQVKEYR